MSWLRKTTGLLVLGLGCTVQIAGSGNPNRCNGDFCVDISSSFYTNEPCIGMTTSQCTYANVYFTATNKDVNVTSLTAAGVTMAINNRQVGVEGASKLTTSNGLVVQLLLDQSYSITESKSTEKIRAGATQFVHGLGESALISVSVFASEKSVPIFLSSGGVSSSTSQTFYPKATAETIVQSYYTSYPAQTSESQTKLYDAVGNLGGLKAEGNGAERLQSVMVIFTDGADTASAKFTSPEAVRGQLGSKNPSLKVYAIGLGAEPNADALGAISDNRFYRAANADEVQKAFDSVSKELTAIYLFKVLVASVESNAIGRLKVVLDAQSVVEQTFTVSSRTQSGAGGGGGGGFAGGGGGGGGTTVKGAVGDPCLSDLDCTYSACLTTFPGGYCTTGSCPCPSGSVCSTTASNCRKGCVTSKDCRDGYMCVTTGGTTSNTVCTVDCRVSTSYCPSISKTCSSTTGFCI